MLVAYTPYEDDLRCESVLEVKGAMLRLYG